MERIHIIGFSGSLRKQSYNAYLLEAARNLAKDVMDITIASIADIPLYNEDIERSAFPDSVTSLAQHIKTADGLLIVTPEYNYSIPGVLKNTIDWLSRPQVLPSIVHKPVGIIGASSGQFGTVRSQMEVRKVCSTINLYVMPKPDVFVTNAAQKFSEDGKLIDEKTQEHVRSFLEAFVQWISYFKKDN